MADSNPTIIVTASADARFMRWDWWSWKCLRWVLGHWNAKPVLVTPESKKRIGPFDGLLLSGGVDIEPARYGQADINSFYCEPERDRLELNLLAEAQNQGIPVLGICRGAQLINVAQGGTLHQDAHRRFRYYAPARHVLTKLFRRKPSYISNSRWLNEIFDPDEKQGITSLHHQAIDRLGAGLTCTADDHYGMVQAIEGTTDAFLLGVQWHPEYQLLNPKQRAIFRIFVEACRKRTAPA